MNNREIWLEKIANSGKVSEAQLKLLDRASTVLTDNIIDSEVEPFKTCKCIMPSPRTYRGIWNWDSAFHAIAVSRWDAELAKTQLGVFFDFQLEDGLFPDVIFEDGRVVDKFGKPPVFPWACVIVYKRCGDKEFLRKAYESYKKNEAFWCNERREAGDRLFHYDSKPDENWLTFVKFESGLDNSVRFDRKIHELWPVDLNCFMVDFYEAMAFISKELDLGEEAVWIERKENLATAIRELLWDEEDGVFYDTDRFTGERERVMAPAIFQPLFAGVATKEQAERLAQIAKSTDKFYPGIPTVSYDNPKYTEDTFWRGPTWLNLAYFTIKGLERYGYNELAEDFTKTILGWVEKNPEDIYEYYNSKDGTGLGAIHFGWSSAFTVELINPPLV
ncbi:MAG: hypothetical protein IKD04_09375 [Clostridia bacterium]|nr:hypothetical protein [Clostridia bacterium]